MTTEREIFTTKDGSKTLFWPKYDEHYHSVNGALTESLHVFIHHGLEEIAKTKKEIRLLEVGFGTGLNAILTYIMTEKLHINVRYNSLEPNPISIEEVKQLDIHGQLLVPEEFVVKFHELSWGEEHIMVPEYFMLQKIKNTVEDFKSKDKFDLIYFDAFAPSSQPELWTVSIFEKMYKHLNKNGILTTYCAKGQVKRDLKSVGFTIESLPGPPGKREMTRARKI